MKIFEIFDNFNIYQFRSISKLRLQTGEILVSDTKYNFNIKSAVYRDDTNLILYCRDGDVDHYLEVNISCAYKLYHNHLPILLCICMNY